MNTMSFLYFAFPLALTLLWLFLEMTDKSKLYRVAIGCSAFLVAFIVYSGYSAKVVSAQAKYYRLLIDEAAQAIDKNDIESAKEILIRVRSDGKYV